MVIGLVVFGAMFWSMIVHRRSTGQQPAHFHESTMVEILWTVIPFPILAVMAVPAPRTLIHMYDTPEPELDVQITGYQWKWQYRYRPGVEFFSNLATPQDQIHNKAVKDEHYLLEVDGPLVGEPFFMYATMLITVPTGVKVFNWASTMWQGSLTFETPMLFVARNPTDKPMTAQAIPSIAPSVAATYFHKTECFCFTQQVLQPGERIQMPVRFIVDRDLPRDVRHLTLAYTLFDITARKPPVAGDER